MLNGHATEVSTGTLYSKHQKIGYIFFKCIRYIGLSLSFFFFGQQIHRSCCFLDEQCDSQSSRNILLVSWKFTVCFQNI